MGLNRFIVAGYVGRDPEAFEANGNSYAGFTLAESLGKDKDGVEQTAWHQVTAGGKKAETILKYVKQGDKLVVDGKATASVYVNKDNKVVPQMKIFLSEFDFASSKDKDTTVDQAE